MRQKKTEKIHTIKHLGKIAAKLKQQGKTIVQCHGVFDLIHPGHIRHLRSAKKYGDILIVTITGDKFVHKGPGRPIFNEHLRSEVLAALEIVDYVAILQSDSAIEGIAILKPHFYLKGPDYKKRKVNPHLPQKLQAEESAVEAIGGKIVFTNDDVVFSSSHLINEHLESYPTQTKQYLDSLRQTYTSEEIIDLLCQLKKKKILVIGDTIIDQYHYTLPMGKSSKEPLVVHIFRSEESFAGGVLATANHIAALSNDVSVVTLLGKKKSFESFIKKHLRSEIKPIFFYQNDAPTIVKRRYIDEVTNQKLFQISYMRDETLNGKRETEIYAYLQREIPAADMVVVNDFGHGLLTAKIIKLICRKAKFLSLNVQANSANYGFNVVTKYPHADFVCMDEHEVRLATHDKHEDLKKLIMKVAKKLKCNELIVTRGWEGSISYSRGSGIVETPALAQSVVDRVGAGDAFFALASLCAFVGMNSTLVSFIGNIAGALKVQSVGNRTPIDFKELTKFLTRLLK